MANKSGTPHPHGHTVHHVHVHHEASKDAPPPHVPPVPADVPPPNAPGEAAQPPVVSGGTATPAPEQQASVQPLAAPVGVYPSPPATGIHAFAITPSDATPLPRRARVIYVGGAGNVAIIGAGDDPAGAAAVFSAVPVGTQLQVDASYVKATGTTATLLVGIG